MSSAKAITQFLAKIRLAFIFYDSTELAVFWRHPIETARMLQCPRPRGRMDGQQHRHHFQQWSGTCRLLRPLGQSQTSSSGQQEGNGSLHRWQNAHVDVPASPGSVSRRQSIGNQVEIKMRFYFSSPDFFLNGVALHGRLTEQDIKIRFHLCQLRLNSDVYNSLSEKGHNKREIAFYPTVRSEIRTFSMLGNQARFEDNNLFQGRIPDRLIVGLVRNEAFNGNVVFNPFSFQKFEVSSIKQIVKREKYPYEP